MSRAAVYQFIFDTLGVPVYQDFVPETQELPAASYVCLDRGTNKPLEGRVDLRTNRYQIEVMHNINRIECDKIADKLRLLDGSIEQPNFQLIDIMLDHDMPITDTNVKVYGIIFEVNFVMRSVA